MAQTFDLLVDEAADYSAEIFYKPNNVIFNLTGFTAKLQIRRDFSSATPALELTQASGLVIDGAAGKITINLTAALTLNLNGLYFYDLVVTNGSITRRVVQGQVRINPKVTR